MEIAFSYNSDKNSSFRQKEVHLVFQNNVFWLIAQVAEEHKGSLGWKTKTLLVLKSCMCILVLVKGKDSYPNNPNMDAFQINRKKNQQQNN